jgi:hypothetical protein
MKITPLTSKAVNMVSALGVIAGLAGCSSQIRVSQIDNKLEAGTTVDGVPFRAVRRYKLALYRLVDGKYESIAADKGAADLPDPDRLYVLQMRGMPLSDDSVIIKIRDDGTLMQLVVDAKGKGKEAADTLTKALGEVDTARTTRNTTTETATTAGEAARLAALKARLDAEEAAEELAALPLNATAVARKTAENKVARLRLEANQKARKAGLPLPFPDVGT